MIKDINKIRFADHNTMIISFISGKRWSTYTLIAGAQFDSSCLQVGTWLNRVCQDASEGNVLERVCDLHCSFCTTFSEMALQLIVCAVCERHLSIYCKYSIFVRYSCGGPYILVYYILITTILITLRKTCPFPKRLVQVSNYYYNFGKKECIR